MIGRCKLGRISKSTLIYGFLCIKSCLDKGKNYILWKKDALVETCKLQTIEFTKLR